MRKWRKNFLILSLYPPSLSISYIKIGHILSQNVKYGIFVANVTKTEHTRYEEIILGRILCEEAPQVVTACLLLTQYHQVPTSTNLYCCCLGITDSCTVYPWSCYKKSLTPTSKIAKNRQLGAKQYKLQSKKLRGPKQKYL